MVHKADLGDGYVVLLPFFHANYFFAAKGCIGHITQHEGDSVGFVSLVCVRSHQPILFARQVRLNCNHRHIDEVTIEVVHDQAQSIKIMLVNYVILIAEKPRKYHLARFLQLKGTEGFPHGREFFLVDHGEVGPEDEE